MRAECRQFYASGFRYPPLRLRKGFNFVAISGNRRAFLMTKCDVVQALLNGIPPMFAVCTKLFMKRVATAME